MSSIPSGLVADCEVLWRKPSVIILALESCTPKWPAATVLLADFPSRSHFKLGGSFDPVGRSWTQLLRTPCPSVTSHVADWYWGPPSRGP